MSQLKEKLNFAIILKGTYWDKVPAYSIRVNSKEYANGYADKDPITVQFTCELEEDHEHTLEIRLENKTDRDCIQSEDKTTILKDMLLNIISIEIDEIELDNLKWSASEFVADDTSHPVLKNCVDLGWNGSYKLKFTSPFYLWLLENM